MPFGRGSVRNKGKNPRITQRIPATLQRMAQAGVQHRISAAGRISAPKRAKSPHRAKSPNRVSVPNAKVTQVVNEREPPPDRGSLRENQDQIAISMVNNKLDTLLELLNVDDPNTNIIMTADQLNVKLDKLIDHIKEKRKAKERERSAERRARDRTEQANRIQRNIQHGAYD